ncbi:hypothetical protein PR048_005845 [Dryococelus australis]|uniref:Integrase catalytic domain-containing protein n=1 Tax=Dryococelus australis TaxID=614101 RepID=A0ABQ9I9C5_9NEOP|nr:hypothetical protein PR048_005845 [Dryococelus australis]
MPSNAHVRCHCYWQFLHNLAYQKYLVRADNGSQFISSNFHCFAQTYNFQVVNSSPHYSQSNGCIEAAVKDISLALLLYRTTPLNCGFSLAELLMDHTLRSTLPLLPSSLEEIVQLWLALNREHLQKEKQAANCNRRDRVRHLPDLRIGDKV